MKFLLLIILFVGAYCLTLAVMINGWGIQPQSWSWIIGGGFGAAILAAVMGQLKNEI